LALLSSSAVYTTHVPTVFSLLVLFRATCNETVCGLLAAPITFSHYRSFCAYGPVLRTCMTTDSVGLLAEALLSIIPVCHFDWVLHYTSLLFGRTAFQQAVGCVGCLLVGHVLHHLQGDPEAARAAHATHGVHLLCVLVQDHLLRHVLWVWSGTARFSRAWGTCCRPSLFSGCLLLL
jgi:hypothetical protein